MAYLNSKNWEHCEEFVNYLVDLHQKEFESAQQEGRSPQRTQLQELFALCQRVPGRTYLATFKNLFSSRHDQCSNTDFVNTIEAWMNDTNFIQDPRTRHHGAVRFGDEYAPNLAYAFEYFINKLKSNDDYTKKIPFAGSMMQWAQREIFQPRWQKALILALMLAMTVLSLLSMGGLLPISFFAISGICMAFCAVGGGSLYLESEEKNGLFTQKKEVHGAKNLDLTAVNAFKFSPLKEKKTAQKSKQYGAVFSAGNEEKHGDDNTAGHSLKITSKK